MDPQPHSSKTFGEITIVANCRKRLISVIDQAEGLSSEIMLQKFEPYGEDSGDRAAGLRTRSLFGKGLRDALFTQKSGAVKSIKEDQCAITEFYFGKIRGSDEEDAIIDIDDHPPRLNQDIRTSWGIVENGTRVEFRLRDDVRFPKREKLIEKLSNFYMLRMINSNSSRRVLLKYIDATRQETIDQIKYIFPVGQLLIRKTFQFDFDNRTFNVELEISKSEIDLSQGTAGYEDREGGLLVLDEDDNILDLTLFKYDTDPAGSRLFGRLRVNGAHEYISTKLNCKSPEPVLSEDREGLVKSHGFYKNIAAKVEEILGPIIEDEEKKRRSQIEGFSPETVARFSKAIDVLNALYEQFVGKADAGDGFTGRNPRLPEYLEFIRPKLTVKEKIRTPVALLINCDKFSTGTEADVKSDKKEIAVEPQRFKIERQSAESPLQKKILRIEGARSEIAGNIVVTVGDHVAELKVEVTDKDIFYPQNGMQFEPANVNIHEESARKLHLFLDMEKIPLGSAIEFSCPSETFSLKTESVEFTKEMKISDEVGCIELGITADNGIGQKAQVKAVSGVYSSEAFLQIVKEKEPLPPQEGGRFKSPRFEEIPHLKVQTWLAMDGAILINTLDPLNITYFGLVNQKDTIEGSKPKLHCQIRLADLVLDECLNKIVTDAYGKGTIDRRYLNNPELDIRQYIAEWKFLYGKLIHQHFVTLQCNPDGIS